MNTKSRFLIPLLLPLALAAQRPWEQITVPAVREAAANFRTPPRKYGAIHWAIWGDELSQARIVREFDQLVACGIYPVNLAPARLRVNGKDLAARAWQPYRWDVTDAVTSGANQIEIETRTLPPGGRGGPSGGAQPAGGCAPASSPPLPGMSGAVRLVAR